MTDERITRAQPELQRRVRLTLDFDSPAEPIRGSLRDTAGPPRAFTGWLGLLCTLEAALTRDAEAVAAGR